MYWKLFHEKQLWWNCNFFTTYQPLTTTLRTSSQQLCGVFVISPSLAFDCVHSSLTCSAWNSPQQNYPNILPLHAFRVVCSCPALTALMGVSKASGNEPDVHNAGISQWSPCWSTFLWFCSIHEHLPLSICQLWHGHTRPSLLIRFHASTLLSCYNVS